MTYKPNQIYNFFFLHVSRCSVMKKWGMFCRTYPISPKGWLQWHQGFYWNSFIFISPLASCRMDNENYNAMFTNKDGVWIFFVPPALSSVVPVPGTFSWPLAPRGKPKRGMLRRAVFSDLQRKALERTFQRQKYISKPDRKKLASKLGLKDSQVQCSLVMSLRLLNIPLVYEKSCSCPFALIFGIKNLVSCERGQWHSHRVIFSA